MSNKTLRPDGDLGNDPALRAGGDEDHATRTLLDQLLRPDGPARVWAREARERCFIHEYKVDSVTGMALGHALASGESPVLTSGELGERTPWYAARDLPMTDFQMHTALNRVEQWCRTTRARVGRMDRDERRAAEKALQLMVA